MDIATVIGLVSGFGLVVTAVLLGGSPQIFVNIPSFLIVIGGTVAATLINYPLKDVLGVMATVKNAFVQTQPSPTDIISKLVKFATVARREGILALEGEASEAGDEFLQKSVQLAVDGTAPELIKDILTTEIAFMEDRHSKGQGILLNMGAMAPAGSPLPRMAMPCATRIQAMSGRSAVRAVSLASCASRTSSAST